MGYRSDVGLCLTKNGVSALMDKLDKSDEETKTLVTDLLSNPEKHFKDSGTGSEIWYWTWLKWYLDYQDVAFIENALMDMDAADYLFIRVGEDAEDNDIQGDFWDNPFDMVFSRSIDFEKSGVQ